MGRLADACSIVAMGIGICGMFGMMIYGMYVSSQRDARVERLIKQSESAIKQCYIIADKDNNQLTSIEEKVQMWKDMNYNVEEYIEEGRTRYKPIEPDLNEEELLTDKVERYEQYFRDNGYNFLRDENLNYTIHKKYSELRN